MKKYIYIMIRFKKIYILINKQNSLIIIIMFKFINFVYNNLFINYNNKLVNFINKTIIILFLIFFKINKKWFNELNLNII